MEDQENLIDLFLEQAKNSQGTNKSEGINFDVFCKDNEISDPRRALNVIYEILKKMNLEIYHTKNRGPQRLFVHGDYKEFSFRAPEDSTAHTDKSIKKKLPR